MHRDIKSDNYLMVSKGMDAATTLRLADFGTSREIKGPETAFNHTAGLGTPVCLLSNFPPPPKSILTQPITIQKKIDLHGA